MYANFAYFWLTACTAVYLGAKRCAAVAKAGASTPYVLCVTCGYI